MKITESVLSLFREELSKHIQGKRLEHSLSVEDEAAELGRLYGLTDESLLKLRASAILHDITKGIGLDGQIELCKKHGIPIRPDDMESPKVFHSITGAEVAKSIFPQYIDGEIYGAIKYHTTGKRQMTLFEKLIYLADYIEKTRNFSDCTELRKYFYSSAPTERHLNETLLISFDMTLKNLIEEGQSIHTDTVEARNDLIAILKKQ